MSVTIRKASSDDLGIIHDIRRDLDIEQMLPAGDSYVVIRWRSKGTHRGPLANIPATGKSATNHGCTVMELNNAKVSRAWVYFDNAHLLRQLGVLPA
jgi:predicted ester cyclase